MASWRQLLTSAGRTTNLVVAGAGGLAAAVTGSLPVLAIGALAYGALVAVDALGSKDRDQPPRLPESRLPDPRQLTDPAARAAVEAMLAAHRELQTVLDRSPESVQRYSGMALSSVPELEEHASQLAARAGELGGYLDGVRVDSVRKERDELRRKASSSSDEQARAQFEEAAAACDSRLKTLQELAGARERLEGHLSRLVATYQSLPGRIVHLRTLDAQAADSMSGTVNEELDRMNSEMGAFELSLKELTARVPA